VVVLVGLPAAFRQPLPLAIIAAVVIAALSTPNTFAGPVGPEAIIRAETAARRQQARDDRDKLRLQAQLTGGAVVFAFGVMDLYLLNRLPLPIDLALIAAGALAWGVKIRWPSHS
jgi:hypothetical protein